MADRQVISVGPKEKQVRAKVEHITVSHLQKWIETFIEIMDTRDLHAYFALLCDQTVKTETPSRLVATVMRYEVYFEGLLKLFPNGILPRANFRLALVCGRHVPMPIPYVLGVLRLQCYIHHMYNYHMDYMRTHI